MLIKQYEIIEKAWGLGSYWIDMKKWCLKGMIISGENIRVGGLKRYDELHLEDFVKGGGYLAVFKESRLFLKNKNEKIVLGIQSNALFVYVVKQHENHLCILVRARVGLFYGRSPEELVEKTRNALANSYKTHSKNPNVLGFLSMFEKSEVSSDIEECKKTFEEISGITLTAQELTVIQSSSTR